MLVLIHYYRFSLFYKLEKNQSLIRSIFLVICGGTKPIYFLILAPFGSNESCPVCADELPSNINDLYCSASSVVKAAIRRLRKARLLLDVQSSHEDIKRLHSTIAFVLRPNCSCSPLDNRKYITEKIVKTNCMLYRYYIIIIFIIILLFVI